MNLYLPQGKDGTFYYNCKRTYIIRKAYILSDSKVWCWSLLRDVLGELLLLGQKADILAWGLWLGGSSAFSKKYITHQSSQICNKRILWMDFSTFPSHLVQTSKKFKEIKAWNRKQQWQGKNIITQSLKEHWEANNLSLVI